jgi:hypothetical protein
MQPLKLWLSLENENAQHKPKALSLGKRLLSATRRDFASVVALFYLPKTFKTSSKYPSIKIIYNGCVFSVYSDNFEGKHLNLINSYVQKIIVKYQVF